MGSWRGRVLSEGLGTVLNAFEGKDQSSEKGVWAHNARPMAAMPVGKTTRTAVSGSISRSINMSSNSSSSLYDETLEPNQ